MKKYTHKALLALSFLFLGLMTISALLLKKEVAVTDLKDPDRDYERIALPPFKYVHMQYGPEKDLDPQRFDNDVNTIEIVLADKDQLLVNKSEKDSLKWNIRQDTLYIFGNDNNIFWNPVAKLLCTHLTGVSANKTSVRMNKCQHDTVNVQLANFGRLEMSECQFNQLQVTVSGYSIADLNNMTINQLQINLKDSSQLKLNETRPLVFQLKNDQSGTVQLKGTSQQYMVVK